jgi:hypothetical protein
MKAFISLAVAGVLLLTSCGYAQQTQNAPQNDNKQPAANTAQNTATPAPSPEKEKWNECKICDFDYAAYKGELNKDEINGLLLALNDEYLAAATYEQINKDHNSPRPFVNIVEAEKRHAERLKSVMKTYGVAIPDNPWTGKTEKFATVLDACRAGMEGEVINRDLYKKLFGTTKREDILIVYRALQQASEQNHLPAFERCTTGGGRGMGPGGGPGRGRPW